MGLKNFKVAQLPFFREIGAMTFNKVIIKIDQEIEDLVPQFMANRKMDLEHLERLLSEESFEEIARLAHKIRGTAGGYGFHELGTFATAIERLAKEKDLGQLAAVTKNMKNYVEAIEVIFVEVQ